MFSKRDLMKLLLPLIVEQILAVLVGMVDVVMVAAVGEAAVSGVSLVDSISMLIIQILAALATGGAVVCAQFIGAQDQKSACRAAGQLLLVTTAFSLAVSAVALIGNRNLLGLIFGSADQTVMDDAAVYFRITALSYPFLAVYNSCAALYRSIGNSKVSMMTSMVMNVINIAGNYLCVYILHMGVEGVAIPTLISRMVAAVLMVLLIQRPGNVIRIKNISSLRWNGAMVKRILSIGVPNGLENGMFQFGKIALQSLAATLGTASIASYAVANNLVTMQYLPGTAIGLGLITIVGQCVGAGKYDEVKKYTKLLIGLNYAFLVGICLIMVAGSDALVGIYNLSPEATEISRVMLLYHSVAMLIWPLAFTLPHALRASFDAKFTMAVSVASMWICRIGLAYVFVNGMNAGILGIWYAMF
ncbi:MAG: MATE family efflux transporter, partial [Lachnospiraceae bacterium]